MNSTTVDPDVFDALERAAGRVRTELGDLAEQVVDISDTMLGAGGTASAVLRAAHEFDDVLHRELRQGEAVVAKLANGTGTFLLDVQNVDDINAKKIEAV